MAYIKKVPPPIPKVARHYCSTPKESPGAGSLWQCDVCGKKWIFKPWYRNAGVLLVLGFFIIIVSFVNLFSFSESRGWNELSFYRAARFFSYVWVGILVLVILMGIFQRQL
jgi:hypothetical protein